MPTQQRVWMTRKAYIGLQLKLAALLADRGAAAGSPSRQARIDRIDTLIATAEVGADPPDDGIAEPGMVISLRYDDTGETETFLLGVRGAEDADIEVYSPQSALGGAIAGAAPGEQRTYCAPGGAELSVTLIHAVPYGRHASKTTQAQFVSPAA